jgi:hypothetical protein
MSPAFSGLGPTVGTYAERVALASPPLGQLFYQYDTDEYVKYGIDADGTNRWMQMNDNPQRNLVINGSFNVWQRGTSFNPTSVNTLSGNNYGVDRWQMLQATNRSVAFSQFAIGTSDPAGYNFCTRVGRQTGDTFVTPFILQTSFESRNLRSVRNKYVTLSFWARAGANYSAASSFLTSQIVRGIGTDGTVGNFTSDTPISLTDHVLTTSWKRFTMTTTAVVPTTTNQLGIKFTFTPTGTAGASDYFDITGVQLEVGTAPSDFEFEQFETTLRKCQRYYQRINAVVGAHIATLTFYGADRVWGNLYYLPTVMRATPTSMSVSSAGHISCYNSIGGSIAAATSINLQSTPQNLFTGGIVLASSIGTTSQPGILVWNNASGWLDLSAEL